jgi:uncharacterized damage-inducible protein DinB
MAISAALLPEYDHEMATARKLLERMPAEKEAWKPHAKSFSLGDLCLHLAQLPGWGKMALTTTELDLNPPGGPGFQPPKYESKEAMLETFDANVKSTREALAGASDAEFMVGWTLKNGGASLFTIPRVAVVRTWVMNHVVHHRGQLSVYLRLLDVPVPSVYGPSADEQGM